MCTDKHSKQRKYRLTPWAALALVLTLVLSVGGTVAFLTTASDTVTNTFTPAPVKCEVVEDHFVQGESTVKTNVCVKNVGKTAAYIRAAIIITWQDEDGNIYGRVPAPDTDYTLKINTADWTKIGDYWYCTKAGNPNTQTAVLIESCEALASLDSYTLSVEILAQAIQAEPIDAVMAAWGNISGLATISPGGDQ